MRSIQAGQEPAFVSAGRRVPTLVRRVTQHPSFDAMLDHEDPRSIGGALGENREELPGGRQWAAARTAAATASAK
jgi:hypothetical protein